MASIISRSLNSSWFSGGSSKSSMDLKSSRNSSPVVAERPENGPRPGAGGHTDDEGRKWAKIVGEEIFSTRLWRRTDCDCLVTSY